MLNSIYTDRPELYWNVRECWLNKRRLDYISHYLGSRPDGITILEIGSGVGGLLMDLAEKFPNRKFLGIEPSGNYCEFADQIRKDRNLTNIRFLAQSSDNLDLSGEESRTFDIILTNDVLHHIGDWDKLLKNLRPYVTVKTSWLSIEPNPYNFYSAYRQSTQPGERLFAKSKFLRLVSHSGWKKKSVNYIFLIPPFVKAPSHWMIELEEKLEGVLFLGGGVCIELARSL